ncbi:(deoxy)nucleoside triphosphate pyrophosphohydrolase [Echinicola jeungdonensis]|uniref:8-oxo-dGTP diphosphatase n=1 Tax=Echinicola jeungdonensis TaxID=709343 RepID=A0ABV5J366_9BACT|nr:(deoxy)nucleoside triphosphate pyrophosphohydrolase [Echinicola jeungdonensis]MDN3670711.1 (deoxy)nucleoside triphosphate pyrophosphohydrolase [Echinicola jeungdonensis]
MIAVTCALIIKDGLVLAVQRGTKMKMPLKWEFPGGKMENGESEQSCLAREIKEELNLEIEIGDKLSEVVYDYPDFTIRLIPYICRIQSGELVLTEHRSHQWLEKEELLDLDWAEADLPIVRDFLKGI